jgi:hypothetical protein
MTVQPGDEGLFMMPSSFVVPQIFSRSCLWRLRDPAPWLDRHGIGPSAFFNIAACSGLMVFICAILAYQEKCAAGLADTRCSGSGSSGLPDTTIVPNAPPAGLGCDERMSTVKLVLLHLLVAPLGGLAVLESEDASRDVGRNMCLRLDAILITEAVNADLFGVDVVAAGAVVEALGDVGVGIELAPF